MIMTSDFPAILCSIIIVLFHKDLNGTPNAFWTWLPGTNIWLKPKRLFQVIPSRRPYSSNVGTSSPLSPSIPISSTSFSRLDFSSTSVEHVQCPKYGFTTGWREYRNPSGFSVFCVFQESAEVLFKGVHHTSLINN